MEHLNRKKLNKRLLDAAKEGKWSIILEALNAGADINARNGDGWTPLMLAIDNHHWYEVKKRVEHGADVLAAAKDGTTVTMLGAASGLFECVPLLPEAINTRDKTGEDALMYAARKGREESIRRLLATGAKPTNRANSGQTALQRPDNVSL